MDPEDIRRKLAEVDVQFAEALRRGGLTEPEIASVLDPRASPEERKRRTDEALASAVARQMSDPGSPLVMEAVGRVVGDLERMSPEQLQEIVASALAEKRARQRPRFAALGIVVVVVAAIALYFVVRPPNPCVAALGPLSELEVSTGRVLRADKPIGPYGGTKACSIYVWEKEGTAPGHIGNPILVLARARADGFASTRKSLQNKEFTSHEPVALGDDAVLFIAGEAPEPSADELLMKAQANAARRPRRSAGGLGYDPIGEALGSLPPPHHVVLVRRGDETFELSFEKRAFDSAGAKAAAAKIIGHVK